MANRVMLNPTVGDLLGHALGFVDVILLYMILSCVGENRELLIPFDKIL